MEKKKILSPEEERAALALYSYKTDIEAEDYDGDFDIQDVLDDFKAHGYDVEWEAVAHNLSAWERDFKSGFRGKDYFLFTPCGCNRLRFDVMRLVDGLDWQETYEC